MLWLSREIILCARARACVCVCVCVCVNEKKLNSVLQREFGQGILKALGKVILLHYLYLDTHKYCLSLVLQGLAWIALGHRLNHVPCVAEIPL